MQVIYCAAEHVYLWVCMEWRDGFLILCLIGMLFQLNIIPCTDDQSIITYALQMGRYFIKQLWYEMKYNSFIKMCTNLVNDIDLSITYAYLYPFIRMQEPFILDKITQLDLDLLNQIPLLIPFSKNNTIINPLLGIFFFFFFGLITLWAV